VIDRRAFLAGGAALLAAPFAAGAQSGVRVPRIGYLGVNRPEDVRHLLEALRLGLREHGWVEGHTIHIDYRWAEGAPDRLLELAGELVRLSVALILAPATQAIQAARRATRDIPIVMVASNDPVSDGFVSGFARPGGNITGLTFDPGLEIGGKHVELLVQAIPRLTRAAVLVNPENRTSKLMNDAIQSAAVSFGLQLQFVQAQAPDQINRAFVAATKKRAGAMLILSDAMLYGQRRRIVDLAATSQLPAIYPWKEAADIGGFMAYGSNLSDNFRRAANFVDRILKGAKPGDLPIEQPTRFELLINLRTAKTLRLTIPPSLLQRADQVIE
jgi:putative ABC transport system substrate-binding protein